MISYAPAQAQAVPLLSLFFFTIHNTIGTVELQHKSPARTSSEVPHAGKFCDADYSR